jgi:hypothetical protein
MEGASVTSPIMLAFSVGYWRSDHHPKGENEWGENRKLSTRTQTAPGNVAPELSVLRC